METRSYNRVAKQLNDEGCHTRRGAQFTVLTIKDIISNPVYCTADAKSYRYFLEKGSNICGEESEWDGKHGISSSNRRLQTKEEADDSTFFNPKFARTMEYRDMSDWIIAVGLHPGLISSSDWIEAQKLKESIYDKYNRPHRKTNAMLAGMIYCPYCNKRLNVVTESGRYTHGKPRFKYECPNAVRKGKCKFQAVPGVELDEFVMRILYHCDKEPRLVAAVKEMIDQDTKKMQETDANRAEEAKLDKEINRLDIQIKQQVVSLRTATDASRRFIQQDLDGMAREMEEKEKTLHRIQEVIADSEEQHRSMDAVVIALQNLHYDMKDETLEYQQTLIRGLIDRIYITTEKGVPMLHLLIKGNVDDTYDEFYDPEHLKEDAIHVNFNRTCVRDGCREYGEYICRGGTPLGMLSVHEKAGRGAWRHL